MIKDYVHRTKNPKKPGRKKALLTTLIIVLAITVPALMYYVRFQKTIHNKRQAKTHLLQPAKITSKKINNNNTQFDFYTILPNEDTSAGS